MTDAAFCTEILPRVSRTFALSIEALPEPLRSSIRVAYLLCRIVDTIEDDDLLPLDRRRWLFDEFRRLLEDDDADPGGLEAAFADRTGSDDILLCQRAGAAFRELRRLPRELSDAARPHIREMADGMAEYAERWHAREGGLAVLRDEADLERYCYFVAGTVGNLLTAIFVQVEASLPSAVREGLQERAVSFGLGLQMTNIVKDVTADRDRGWCFVPASTCDRHRVSPAELLDPASRDRAMEALRDVVGLARRHLDGALEYTLLLPRTARDVRLFVLVPLVLALASLTLVERSPEVLERGRAIKVSRETVAAALAEARRVVSDDEGIRSLCARAARLEI